MNAQNLPALPPRIGDLIAEYDKKAAAADDMVESLKSAVTNIEFNSTVRGRHPRTSIWGRYGTPSIAPATIRESLLKSAWWEVYHAAHIDQIAPASDRQKFERAMENPPEFNADNIMATFGRYVEDPRAAILRGLAEAFADLDPFFRSHSKVRVGVKGLPKRIIITNVNDWGSHGYDRLRDVLNAVRVFEGEPHLSANDLRDLMNWDVSDLQEWQPHERYQTGAKVMHGGAPWVTNSTRYPAEEFEEDPEGFKGWRKLVHPMPGIEIRRFQNGNAHIHFDRDRLVAINKALAEFYGEVLPDVEVDEGKPRPSTELSRDLAFYATPRAVLDRIWNWTHTHVGEGGAILEPSAGEGAIVDFLREAAPGAEITAIEVDRSRHERLREKGIGAWRKNFLEVIPDARFDLVLMNPPFAGKTWQKHVAHAIKFLKPRDPEQRFGNAGVGRLIAILPATAFYDGHLKAMGLLDRGQWHDLPVASFAESGTNVPTGFFTMWA